MIDQWDPTDFVTVKIVSNGADTILFSETGTTGLQANANQWRSISTNSGFDPVGASSVQLVVIVASSGAGEQLWVDNVTYTRS